MLLDLLSDKCCKPGSVVLILGYVINSFDTLGDPKILDPYMPKVRSFKASAGDTVEKLEDR